MECLFRYEIIYNIWHKQFVYRTCQTISYRWYKFPGNKTKQCLYQILRFSTMVTSTLLNFTSFTQFATVVKSYRGQILWPSHGYFGCSVCGIWFCGTVSTRRKICRVEVRRDLVGGMKRDHPHVGKCEVWPWGVLVLSYPVPSCTLSRSSSPSISPTLCFHNRAVPAMRNRISFGRAVHGISRSVGSSRVPS